MIDVESITGKIINADCMDILKELPDKCIDLVLTDPPYGGWEHKPRSRFGGWFDKYHISNKDRGRLVQETVQTRGCL